MSLLASLSDNLSLDVPGGFRQFHQNPPNDKKKGDYRLFSQIDVKFCCDGDNLLKLTRKTDKDGGLEGLRPQLSYLRISPWLRPIPIIRYVPYYGTMNLDVKARRTSNSSVKVGWLGWGNPNPTFAEPLIQGLGGARASVKIWHKGVVTFYCQGGVGYTRIDGFVGSKYPSHRLWVNGVKERDINQEYYSDLWEPSATDPTFVK